MLRKAESRKVSLWRTVRAVAWSFIGLRSRSGYEDDVRQLNLLHVVVVGLVAVMVFVGALVLLVRWVVGV